MTIKEARIDMGMTQAEMLHGTKTITMESKVKILKALGIEINEVNINKYFEKE